MVKTPNRKHSAKPQFGQTRRMQPPLANDAFTPEGRSSDVLKRLRRFSFILDNAIPIPGTPYRIGLDPILGLAPGIGDWIATMLSSYVLVEAIRLGAPQSMLLKMAGNIALESVLGAFPIVGDLFDATWKANARNVDLLESHFNVPTAPVQPDSRRLWVGIGLVLLLGAIALGLSLFTLIALLRLLF